MDANTDSPIGQSEPVEIKMLYANGFQVGLSNADSHIVFVRNGKPQMLVNLSYTTAKSLALALADAIQKLEKATDHKIMTVDDAFEAVKTVASANQKMQ